MPRVLHYLPMTTKQDTRRAAKLTTVIAAMRAYGVAKSLPSFGGLVLARAMQESAFGPSACEPITFGEHVVVKSLRFVAARDAARVSVARRAMKAA